MDDFSKPRYLLPGTLIFYAYHPHYILNYNIVYIVNQLVANY